MAGTQKYGRADYQLGDGAHHACGKEFPTCNGDFMPYGDARLVDIHLTHRFFMYLAVIAVVVLAVMLFRRGMKRHAYELAGLLVVQVLLGALNVWLDEYEAADPGPPDRRHPAVGGAAINTVFELSRAPARVARGRPRPTGDRLMEAVALRRRAGWRTVVSDYFEMTKPKVQSLLLFTTVTTMYVAGDPSLGLVALTCLGGALSAGGAGAINHAYRSRP